MRIEWRRTWVAVLAVSVFSGVAWGSVAARPVRAASDERAAAQGFRFAAITDTHIAAPAELARFREFLYTIQDEKPDFLLILGDLCGHAPEYLPQIKEVIDHSGLTVYTIPGNHDDNYARNPEWYGAAWPQSYYSFDHKGWHFVMSDSQLLLDAKDPKVLAWVRKELASQPAGRPVIFCQHYPPKMLKPGQNEDLPEPWGEVAKSANVKTALTGHEHRRATYPVGRIRCEVLDNCFFTNDAKDPAKYYLFETTAAGAVRLDERDVAKLRMREPADHVPTVQIQTPSDGSVLKGVATFSGTAADDHGVAAVQYSVDLGQWQKADLAPKGHWHFAVDTHTLGDTHHIVRVRAIDTAAQASIQMGNVLFLVENVSPGKSVFRLQQGRNGYDGCQDATVRMVEEMKGPAGEDGYASDLECWVYKTSSGQLREFNEFYIRFGLSRCGIPAGAKIKRATLTLYGSRQNHVDVAGKACAYGVAALQEGWSPEMTFVQRPASPAWAAATQPEPQPTLRGGLAISRWPAADRSPEGSGHRSDAAEEADRGMAAEPSEQPRAGLLADGREELQHVGQGEPLSDCDIAATAGDRSRRSKGRRLIVLGIPPE